MTRIRGYKYRAYPNKKQREFFEKTFGCCRFIYNHYLEAKQQVWNECHDTLSYPEMCKDLSRVLKKENAWLKEADSIALQQSLRHLDRAYDNFFKRRGGYPKFKSKRSAQSYRTMNVNCNIRIDGDRIVLPKAGIVKIVNTRDFEGRILSATVTMTASGRYYISLQAEEEYEVMPNRGGEIGIDVGLKVLYTDSDSCSVINPKALAKHEKRIRRLQRSLSRKQKGSGNREKARRKLAIEHEKVANIRSDFQHKISYRLANENQVVCIEDLDVKGMMSDHRLAKAISDASWSGFYRKLEYKMADHGGVLIRVPKTYPSSRRCSCCGKINHEVRDLSVRRWTCPDCGAEHDRDINAAKNILEKGLEMLAS
ncbi:MAG: IS200/IS605 family element transposase accessory protein TnpB [Mogibacterium sp.]|nr:IS200/IS605 family element transposase accessory protein TnpB [Mogibacterium sp.]MBR3331793.1 IS200/IS605 family element transposase accessory protein TnpB [Mogibacterium sp.]MBR4090837.1 IS200/IS605 family element transposase accessory protein TnpB [Mogibacterium sp.]